MANKRRNIFDDIPDSELNGFLDRVMEAVQGPDPFSPEQRQVIYETSIQQALEDECARLTIQAGRSVH